MGNAKQPYVVCIGNAELLQDLRFEPDAKGVIQPNSGWRWQSFAGSLARLLENLGCRTKLITKAYSDPSGQYLQQLLKESGLDVRIASTEPWHGMSELGPSHAIKMRVIQKDEPQSLPVSRHASGPNLRFDEIPMEDLQGADLVVITSLLESKPAARPGCSIAPTCNFTDFEWRRLNDTLSAASQIGRQGIPVMCMMGLPILGAMDEMVGNRIDELVPHLQHIKFLWVGGLFADRSDAVLAMLLQKLKTELPHVFFTEIVVVVDPPAPPAAEQGASCSLRSPYKRFMCWHTLAEESSVSLDSELKPTEQDLLFLSGFIASHLQGNSVKDSMEEGARLAQDAKVLDALTAQ